MLSLTRVDAQRRAALITPQSYDVQLDLTGGEQTFTSTTTIRFTSSEVGAGTFVDVKPRELRAATLNGEPLDVDRLFSPGNGRLRLDRPAAQNELIIDALMAYSHDGEGLHRYVDPADGQVYVYAMSFLDAAPRWFASFDQPDLKAPFTLGVTCPPEWTAIANGAANRVAPGRWQFATTRPLATYFTTVVAGPYHSVTDEHHGIPLAIHARASLAEHLDREAPELLAVTRDCLDEFHRLFGVRYPWGEYHQAFVPEFNAGAMENPGCVTFRDQLVFRSRVTDAERGQRSSTVAHEMAHMWFGDLVTMRWWDDLWLNESLAEYLGTRVCDAVTPHPAWVEFGILRKSWGYAADRRPSTHPVAGNGAADAASALSDFDGISYAKGASVLKQLAAHLGDRVFLGGLRQYFTAHAYGNAEFGDLVAAWTSAGAVDLPAWADQWLRTSDVDTLRVGTDGVHREPPPGSIAVRPHSVTVAAIESDGRERGRTAVALHDGHVALPSALVEPAPALLLANAGDETWAKIALDSSAWQAMASVLPAIDDQVARVVVWNSLRLAVADAEVDPAVALQIVESVLPGESADAVVSTILRWTIGTVCATHLADAARPAALARVADIAERTVQVSPAGSGRQLAAVRGLLTATSDVPTLRRWLTDEGLPDGVLLDAELRWAVLARMSTLGALTADEIGAEAQRDHSAQGAVHAARCRALRPDPAAKQEAWRILMTDTERSNYELYATAEGFWQPEQTSLTAPYVERYFAEIATTAAIRSGWVVGRVAQLAYPSTAVGDETLAATEQLLADPDLDMHVRRSVVDAGDDLRRALASRRRYSA